MVLKCELDRPRSIVGLWSIGMMLSGAGGRAYRLKLIYEGGDFAQTLKRRMRAVGILLECQHRFTRRLRSACRPRLVRILAAAGTPRVKNAWAC